MFANRKSRCRKILKKIWKMGGAAARLQSAINTIHTQQTFTPSFSIYG